MAPRFDRTLLPDAPDLSFETALWQKDITTIAGVDEAGRGAWAGPVVAAAVILPFNFSAASFPLGLRDSKQLSAEKRARLEPAIKAQALAWGIGCADNTEIDRWGIIAATRAAMTRALDALQPAPKHILIDALFLPEINTAQTALIKGDQRSLSIAAASILAKTARDRWMEALALNEPCYKFERNKGYGTRAHQAALAQHGACQAHRFSFAPLKALCLNSEP